MPKSLYNMRLTREVKGRLQRLIKTDVVMLKKFVDVNEFVNLLLDLYEEYRGRRFK